MLSLGGRLGIPCMPPRRVQCFFHERVSGTVPRRSPPSPARITVSNSHTRSGGYLWMLLEQLRALSGPYHGHSSLCGQLARSRVVLRITPLSCLLGHYRTVYLFHEAITRIRFMGVSMPPHCAILGQFLRVPCSRQFEHSGRTLQLSTRHLWTVPTASLFHQRHVGCASVQPHRTLFSTRNDLSSAVSIADRTFHIPYLRASTGQSIYSYRVCSSLY